MTRDRIIRTLAGSMVLISTLGAYFIHINFIWLGVFVGVNLFQFGFTQWCLMDEILKRLGVKSDTDSNRNT